MVTITLSLQAFSAQCWLVDLSGLAERLDRRILKVNCKLCDYRDKRQTCYNVVTTTCQLQTHYNAVTTICPLQSCVCGHYDLPTTNLLQCGHYNLATTRSLQIYYNLATTILLQHAHYSMVVMLTTNSLLKEKGFQHLISIGWHGLAECHSN